MKDITLGQYYPVESVIHSLDPRVKIFGTFMWLICLFLCKNIVQAVFILAAFLSLSRFSKVPLKFMTRGLKTIVVLLVFSSFFNLFLIDGTKLFSIGPFTATYEGLSMALFLVFRLILIITGSSVLTLTTRPSDLTDGLEKSFGFLEKVRFPVHGAAMMLTIAIRFIPILAEETEKIKKAQMARGADFDEGGVITRIKGMVPLLIPLFVSAFRRASDLALAMEARCYVSASGRTKLKPLRYTSADYISYCVIAAFTALIIITR